MNTTSAVTAAPRSRHEGEPEAVIQKYDATLTQFVESGGTKFAFRQFGKESDVRLIPLTLFRASMENGDPKLLGDSVEKRT